jgi:hypothetical protein
VSQERRREPRYLARITARITRQGEQVDLVTDNVSFRGLFLRTDAPPGLRQLIRVGLVLPSGLVVSAHAMVVHVRKPGDGGGVPGAGLQFWGAMQHSDEWQQFVRSLAAEQKNAPKPAPKQPPPIDKVRRSSQRVKLTLEVVLGGDPTVTRDVSETGMAIRTEAAADVGARLTLVVRGGQRAYPIEVIVRRKIDEPGFRGLGVEFADLTPKVRAALVGFIRVALNPPKKVQIVKPGDPDLH